MTQRTFPLFFEVLRVLVEARVTVVAEAAFQDERWRDGLAPLLELAELRIVRCRVEPAVSFERAVLRAATSDHRRRAHGDSTLGKHLADWEESFVAFEYPSLAPAIDVDTTDGYAQGLDEIVAFVNGPGASSRSDSSQTRV